MLNLDETERNILSITEDTEISMTVHGKTNLYRPMKVSDNSWEMKVMDEDKSVYGLSCESLKEVRATLLLDYAIGIITNAEIKSPSLSITTAPTI